MDKKQLTAIVDSIVADVAAQNGLEEAEARTLVGIMLRKSKDAVVKAVTSPTLGLVSNTPAA